MQMLLIFFPGVLLQLAAYWLLRRLRYSSLLVLLLFLALYIFVIPAVLSPALPEAQITEDGHIGGRCGMPLLATYMIYGLCWCAGGGLTLLTHVLCLLQRRHRACRSA